MKQTVIAPTPSLARRMRVGILGASYETPNLGVSALAAGAVRSIRNCYPDAEVFFLEFERQASVHSIPDGVSTVDVPLAHMRFSWKIWLPNNILVLLALALCSRILPTRGLRNRVIGINTCLRRICESELFGAVSGGDSFSDLYGLSRFFYVTLPSILVLILGRPLVLLPQTYGPFRSSLASKVALWIVRRSSRVFCRDYRSLPAFLDQVGAGRDAIRREFCYDMAFGIDALPPGRIEIEGLTLDKERSPDLVGLNVSGLLYKGGYSENNQFGLRSNYREMIAALIERLVANGARVLLVPHVFAESGSEAESDSVACEELYSQLAPSYPGKLGVLRGIYTPHEMRYITGFCSFFLGSRMHACIGALSLCVPAVGLAYSDKFLAVLETVGIPSLAMDIRFVPAEDLMRAIDEAWASRATLSRQLEETIPQIRNTVHRLFQMEDVTSKDGTGSSFPCSELTAR